MSWSSDVVLGDIIPASRRIAWQGNVGVPGGIPRRTIVFANVQDAPYYAKGNGVADDTAAIQNAINACPSNQVVYLPSGKYRVTGSINIGRSCTLRGDGPGATVIDAYGSSGAVFAFGPAYQTFGFTTNIVSGSTAGSINLTLGSASGASAGQYLLITELNPDFVSTTGDNGECTWCGGVFANDRVLGQIAEITSLVGSNLQISPPLYTTYSNEPLASLFSASVRYAGIEDITLRANHTGYFCNFSMNQAACCWLKNVESDYADGDHVRMTYSFRCEVRDSFFHDGFLHSPGTTDDCLLLGNETSGCLLENNIFYRMHVGVMFNWGAAGNVVAYNFSTGHFDSGSQYIVMSDFDFHGAHPMFNLVEGNIGVQFRPDSTWGSSSHGTVFRNWFSGTTYISPPLIGRSSVQTNSGWWATQFAHAVDVSCFCSYYNIVGNIVGSSWMTTNNGVYLTAWPAVRDYDHHSYCYSFGYGAASDAGSFLADSTIPYNTAILHGNWDWVTKVQTWATSIPDHGLPNSFYLVAKPSWFGTCPWPPIDPNNPTALSVTNLPAGYRFTFGVPPPPSLGLAPMIVVSASRRDYGVATVGSSNDLTFVIKNTGGGVLAGNASVAPPFSVVGSSSYSLGSNASQKVTIRYTPTQSGTHSRVLTFTGGSGANVTVNGSATGP